MNTAEKVIKLIKEQGLCALYHTVSYKLLNRRSEESKYAAYIRDEKKRMKAFVQGKDISGIKLLCMEDGTDIYAEIEAVDAPFVAILKSGNELSPYWRQLSAAFLQEHENCRFLYADEDCVISGKRKCPVFKPDWSPDTYACFDYIGVFFILDSILAKHAARQMQEKNRLYGDGFLYELGLRAAAMLKPEEIGHLPEVLLHRCVYGEAAHIASEDMDGEGYRDSMRDDLAHTESGNVQKCAEKKVQKQELLDMKIALLQEWGINASVFWREEASCADILYVPKKQHVSEPNKMEDQAFAKHQPLVSIIIPSKDNPELLSVCMNSIEAGTRYSNVEWIIVDNGGTPAHRNAYEALFDNTRFPCRYIYEPAEFNFSKMCNRGAKEASGEILLFLNDDIELPTEGTANVILTGQSSAAGKLAEELNVERADWLFRLVGQAAQPHTGAVGAKLLYPGTDKIQHLGMVNYADVAAHLLWQASDAALLPMSRNHTTQNYIAVTGACLMIDAGKFHSVGGFNEELSVTLNDVDLCFKLLEAGYYNVVRTDVVLYHHESLTRGQDALDEEKMKREKTEIEKFCEMHPELPPGKDPFYSCHLTQLRKDHTMDWPVVKFKLH